MGAIHLSQNGVIKIIYMNIKSECSQVLCKHLASCYTYRVLPVMLFFSFSQFMQHFNLIFTRKSRHPPKLHKLSVQTQRENNNSMLNVF